MNKVNEQDIRNIIKVGLENDKISLNKVKKKISDKSCKAISRSDEIYINRKYIKLCSKLWLKETKCFLRENNEGMELTIIRNQLLELGTVKYLNQIPEPFSKLDYFKLLKKNNALLKKNETIILTEKFKKVCLKQIENYNDSAHIEQRFVELLFGFLGGFKNDELLNNKLEIKNFCEGKLPFEEFVSKVINLDEYPGENLTALQDTARNLKRAKYIDHTEAFIDIISSFIKPFEIKERELDGRALIEVLGMLIVVSDVLKELEPKLLANPEVEEVHFVVGHVIHIDAGLRNDLWHGKNIVVCSPKIHVHDAVTWDFSGEDNKHTYSSNAGSGVEGHGKQGADGYPGESGGNVFIQSNQVVNSEKLTIISNGGKGSNGQDGGNGCDGKQGTGITKSRFDELFPFKTRSVVITIAEAFAHVHRQKIKSITEEPEHWEEGGNHFIFGKTQDNIEITYSSFVEKRVVGINFGQDFLICKGSQGQPGKPGGDYGLGGQGGHEGTITVPNECIVTEAIKGENEKNGICGKYGKHGKNGWDIGYTYTQFWKNPKFYGTDENTKLTLIYYDKNDRNKKRIMCPMKEKFVEVKTTKLEPTALRNYEQRFHATQSNERKHQSQPTKKKPLLEIHRTGFSEFQNFKNKIQNHSSFRSKNENKEKAKQKTELAIKRVNLSNPNKAKSCTAAASVLVSAIPREPLDPNAECLISALHREPLPLNKWLQLSGLGLDSAQLDQLFSILMRLKQPIEKNKPQPFQDASETNKFYEIEQLLIEKYRIASLQEIAKKLPPNQDGGDSRKLTPECEARFLVEFKDNDYSISHRVLGTLDQYLFDPNEEKRNMINKFCEEDLQSSEDYRDDLARCLKAFVLEAGRSDQVSPAVQRYYDGYKHHDQRINMYLQAFGSELSQPRHAGVYKLWTMALSNESTKPRLKQEIEKDQFLRVLYNRFLKESNKVYDMDKCCRDEAVLKEYTAYVWKASSMFELYRLLSLIFNINIRLYVESQSNKISLQDSHNPSSNQTVYLLVRDATLTKLELDPNYLKLHEERSRSNDLYNQILAQVDTLKSQETFHDYLRKQPWLGPHKLGLSNQSQGENDSLNEEQEIKTIVNFFPPTEGQQIKEHLEKITSQYIGQQDIIHHIMRRFSYEGRHVSSQELCCLVNAVLSSVVEGRQELHIFSWIVAAYPQQNWVDEILLLQLENYFKRPLAEKSQMRGYLSKIYNKGVLLLFSVKLNQHNWRHPISIESIAESLQMLSTIPQEELRLEGLELTEWPYALREKYWTFRLSSLITWQETKKLPTAICYVLSLENKAGTTLVEELINNLQGKRKELTPKYLINILSNFLTEKWVLRHNDLKLISVCQISEWIRKMDQTFSVNDKNRDIAQLVELIEGNANSSHRITSKLPALSISIRNVSEMKHTGIKRRFEDFDENDIKEWTLKKKLDHIKQKQNIGTLKNVEMLAVIDRAIELRRGFKLRDTQKLSVMALFTNDKNTLAQVSTGEGKSLIVVAVSIMKALCGEKVDVITSSSVLATRDAKENRDIFELFGINVSHNCSEKIEERKQAYSNNKIVYGDLSNFQRDYLLDTFYKKNILGDRRFDNVIVDEVDSMLLDNANNSLYLSRDLAYFDTLESVYLFIWQWINRPATNGEGFTQVFNSKAIKDAVLFDLYGTIKEEDVRKLDLKLSEKQTNVILECLTKAKITDDQGLLLKDDMKDIDLKNVLPLELSKYQDRLYFLLKNCIERERHIHVPNCLKPFVKLHLEAWISNAITALFMQERHDYVVDVDRTGSSPDRNPNIIILDRDTGTDQANSQWDDALHQFLQLKHGCRISLQSLKAVFISNVSYLKLYNKLYGLTGTLGSRMERELLKEIHEVDFLTIPTAIRKTFLEKQPIVCSEKEEWIKTIHDETKTLLKEKRSVLIICQTVEDVETLHECFFGKYAGQLYTYKRDYEDFDIVQGNEQLKQGQIIISTNLAGRGTDIKLTQGLKDAGGLHVCVTFLPGNIRIEEQAFGRVARCGDEGSGQLIILRKSSHGCSILDVMDLRKDRDEKDLMLKSIEKSFFAKQIETEEKYFGRFTDQYEKLKHKIGNSEIGLQDILLNCCYDRWVFWLDKHSKRINDLKDEQSERDFDQTFNKFILQFDNLEVNSTADLSAWVEGNPVQMMKLGKYLLENYTSEVQLAGAGSGFKSDEATITQNLENAQKFFNQVIEEEPHFSEAAHYYKSFAIGNQIDWKKPLDKQPWKEFESSLREAQRLLNKKSTLNNYAAGVIKMIKKNHEDNIILIDGFEKQQMNIGNLYIFFSQSIDDILGGSLSPESFVNHELTDDLAEIVFANLLRKGILKQHRLKEIIPEEELKTIGSEYGISNSKLMTFLDQYNGKDINKIELAKSFKESMKLPSREKLWKILIKDRVLN